MYCGSDMSIVISAHYGVCNSFFTKSFSGLFPFCSPHYDARNRVSIMTGFALVSLAAVFWMSRNARCVTSKKRLRGRLALHKPRSIEEQAGKVCFLRFLIYEVNTCIATVYLLVTSNM